MVYANARMYRCGEGTGARGRGQGQEGGGQGAGIEGASRTGKTRRAISLLFFDKAPCDIVAIAKIDIHVDFPEIH